MPRPPRPSLASGDDLTAAAGIDIDVAIADLIRRRSESPIVRPSRAADVAALLELDFPDRGGASLDELAAQISRVTERYPRRNTHPGFFGWIAPSGLPSDPLACAMVAVLNENVPNYRASPVGATIERGVIQWLAELAGFPPQAEGVLLSGGSIANLSGIASAVSRRFGPDYRNRGLSALGREQAPAIACSAATHFSVRRAAVMLGIGIDQIRIVDTDDAFRMRAQHLQQILEQQNNIVCVVATAGTTNTGAIDPLDEIADLCDRHETWLHIDAAYGGGGLMSAELRPRYRGIERADSLTMDLHKWFYQSLDCSLLLYRDAAPARHLFMESADYLDAGSATVPEEYAFFQIGPELSRRSRALPLYIAMRHYGIDRLGRNALHNVRCAEYLADLVEHEPLLELIAAPQLSILCFRFRPPGLDDGEVDRINRAIRERIQLAGDYLMSPSQVHGRPVLRACIMNHATRAEHVEGLLDSVLRIGRELLDTSSADA